VINNFCPYSLWVMMGGEIIAGK